MAGTRAAATLLETLQKAAPKADFEVLRVRLKYEIRPSAKPGGISARRLNITNRRDRQTLLDLARKLFDWASNARHKGRPPDDSNILVYHVVNHVTHWKRAQARRSDPRWPDMVPLYDRRGRHKLERRWGDAAEILIWLHYHQLRMPWLDSFIRNNARANADRALLQLQKVIQRRYAHLAYRASRIRQREGQEGGFCPLGTQRIVAYPDRLTAWEL